MNDLDLSDNKIGEKGVIMLKEGLERFGCRIRYLNLENNRLGDVCIGMICLGLERNSSVRKLILARNLITDKGCKVISELMLHNVTI